MSRVIAGVGFRRDIAAEDIVAVVRDAGLRAGRRIDALAAPDFKADAEGLQHAARALALPLLRVSRDALMGEQGRCLTRSESARRATGFASVAEAAALAAAGAGGRLLLARVTGARATCALAESA
jgi:cobalt-precorrin 5A hydrolase